DSRKRFSTVPFPLYREGGSLTSERNRAHQGDFAPRANLPHLHVPFINHSRIPRALSIYYDSPLRSPVTSSQWRKAMAPRREKRLLSALSIALLAAFPASAAERDAKIQRAINRGVKYLKGLQGLDGEWTYSAAPDGKANVGATALA